MFGCRAAGPVKRFPSQRTSPEGTPRVPAGTAAGGVGLSTAGGVGVFGATFMGVISSRHEMRALFAATGGLGYRGRGSAAPPGT